MPSPSFNTDQILSGLRRWVEMETPTDAPAAINRLMDLVAADSAGFGLSVERVPGVNGYGDHLITRTPWGQDAPGILVLSHLDTVHPLGFIHRLPFTVRDGCAYGPGICDMKGGAYLAFHAVREMIAAGRMTPLGITHLYTSDEEVGSHTSRALIETLGRKAKVVLVTEPGREGGKVVTARKGVGQFELHITGRAAHAGSWHQNGRSALKEMARQILILEGFTDYARGVTVNPGVARGGTRPNVVAEEAWVEIDLRVPSPALAEEMVSRVLGLKAHEDGVTVRVQGGMNRPAYVKDERIAALFAHAKALAAEIGFVLDDVATGGASDGNFTAPFVPTLDGLGIEGADAHTNQERIFLNSVEPRARLMFRLLETLT